MDFRWLIFLIGSLHFIAMQFGEDQEQTSWRHMFENYRTTSSSTKNYDLLNNDQNWENTCIQLRNQQTWTYDNHT